MILLELKQYIKKHQQVTLQDIQNHFDITEDAALGLIEPLIKQGFIQSLDSSGCESGSCSSGCDQNNHSISYLWLGKAVKKLTIPIEVI